MSQRHYIEVVDKKDNSIALSLQILGNNDYFDDEFYDHMGIDMDEDCCFEVEIKDFAFLTLKWHNYLDRHPEKRGLPNINKETIDRIKNDIEQQKEFIYLHYATALSYELQIYEVAKEISQFLNYNGKVKDGYTLRFMSY